MDPVSLADAAAGLMEKFEALSKTPGDGLAGNGPAVVSHELELRFQELMSSPEPSASGGMPPDASPDAPEAASICPSGPLQPGPAEVAGPPSTPAGSVQSAMDDRTLAVRAPGETILPAPEELCALQFRTEMLRAGVESVDSVRSKTSQDIDSILRAQS